MPRVLALSSHVVRGSVGLAATVPALQSLGHEVWALPTITLAARPGLGHAAAASGGRRVTTGAEITAMLAALEADGCWRKLDAVLIGYFATPDAVHAAAEALARIKSQNGAVRVLVDPIIGDGGRLYVSAETAGAIRDHLLPLADIATPNRFELQWLAGLSAMEGENAIEAAARGLGPALVCVTSAIETHDSITTMLVVKDGVASQGASRRVDAVPNGTGDLFDGLLLGHLLRGYEAQQALAAALGMLARVLEPSAGCDVLQLDRLFSP